MNAANRVSRDRCGTLFSAVDLLEQGRWQARPETIFEPLPMDLVLLQLLCESTADIQRTGVEDAGMRNWPGNQIFIENV